jgi:protease-4
MTSTPARGQLVLAVLVVLAALASVAIADDREPRPMLDYVTQTPWLPETPGVTSGAVGGFVNPAAWSTLAEHRPEFAFWFDDRDRRPDALDNYGFATSGWLGFGLSSRVYERPDGGTIRVNDWQSGLSFGDRDARLGLAYRWSSGDDNLLGREQGLVFGALLRGSRATSLGVAHTRSLESAAHQTVLDVGLRPLGSDRLVVFADYTLDDGQVWDDGHWGAGLAVQPLRGLHLGGRLDEVPGSGDPVWTVNVGVSLADLGLHALPRFDQDGDVDATTVLIRSNPPLPNLVDDVPSPWREPPRYAPLNLENRLLTYQRYRWFDDRRVAWLDLAAYLDAVGDDPDVTGLVLDLRDFVARPSLAWELRQRLLDLQASGHEIVAVLNRVDIQRYYLASVADHIVMDPEGDLVLQGVAAGRSYIADMLERVGLGFQELRYFKYKSAAETGSRMTMSEGQREQSQRMVDVIYEEFRRGICQARGLTIADFDRLVDDAVGLAPRAAVEAGLVDAVGRRADVRQWLREQRGAVIAPPDPDAGRHAYPEAHWSEPSRIAVVYAVGGCAMDSGIEGRATGRYLERLADDPRVAAVVLRADSPGGDPLPSDLVASGLQRCRDAGKPVIVSQGDVAASGGYWISMNGDEILTTPLTITGSIGVIAAWLHDDGASGYLGINYDGVKRGEHADLLRTVREPLLGLGVPHRGLDEKELGLVKEYILEAYDAFVARVAEARGLEEAHVREVAQGRVWMGGDAIDHDLCDAYGGLSGAIDLARARAGLAPDDEVVVTQYPPQPLIDLSGLVGGGLPLGLPFGLTVGGDEAARDDAWPQPWATFASSATPSLPGGEAIDWVRWYVELMAGAPGRPQAVLPPDELPVGWTVGE